MFTSGKRWMTFSAVTVCVVVALILEDGVPQPGKGGGGLNEIPKQRAEALWIGSLRDYTGDIGSRNEEHSMKRRSEGFAGSCSL